MTRWSLPARSIWPPIGLLVGVASVVHGEEIRIVVPNGYANEEAPSSTTTSENARVQYIYAADQFAELPAGGAYLTGLRHRPDGATSSPADLFVDELTLSASVTNVAPQDLSLEFARNITGPVTLVRATAPYQGHTNNIGPPGGPKEFDIGYVLDTPYRYNPTEGNLLLDGILRRAVVPIYVDRLAAADKSKAAAILARDPESPIALGSSGSPVTEFTFVPRLEGACCLQDGTCAEELTSIACSDLGGTFRGSSTACGDGSICLGACCKGINGCSETLVNGCTGDFNGYGSTCVQGCPCPDPFADIDRDGDVDQDDFAVLQTCLTGPFVAVDGICLCFDGYPVEAPDGHVDSQDLWRFELCASGPAIPLNPACDTW